MKKLILPLLLVCSLVAFAADTKIDPSKFKEGGCCQKAAKTGDKCNHPCCVKAAKDGKVCEKCNPADKAEPVKK